MKVFVDTNYWVRYLTDVESEQGKIAHKLLLEGARGKVKLVSSLVVMLEIYWVMASVYETKQGELQKVLIQIMKLDYVEWEQEKLLQKAIEKMDAYNFDLEDAYNLEYAQAERTGKLASFDKKLIRQWER